jgi:hypothetical protein
MRAPYPTDVGGDDKGGDRSHRLEVLTDRDQPGRGDGSGKARGSLRFPCVARRSLMADMAFLLSMASRSPAPRPLGDAVSLWCGHARAGTLKRARSSVPDTRELLRRASSSCLHNVVNRQRTASRLPTDRILAHRDADRRRRSSSTPRQSPLR